MAKKAAKKAVKKAIKKSTEKAVVKKIPAKKKSAKKVAVKKSSAKKSTFVKHETKLKAGGFQPELLRKAKAGTAYIICDVPENQISKIKEGSSCFLQFTAFPNEKFVGKIDDVADGEGSAGVGSDDM